MTYDDRVKPHQIAPLDAAGDILPDGTYILPVVDGETDGLTPSVPMLLLPHGSDASFVPAGTPVPAIILMKG